MKKILPFALLLPLLRRGLAGSLLLLLSFGAGREGAAYAQVQEHIDSLQTALTKTEQDSNRVKILNTLSEYAFNHIGNSDTAVYFAQSALKLAQKIDDKIGEAHAYNNIGIVNNNNGNYPEALKNYTAALKIYQSLDDKKEIAGCYNYIGAIYRNQGNYPEALKNHIASLKLMEAIEDKRGIASCHSYIGIIYRIQGIYPEALKNLQAALEIYKHMGNNNGIASCYLNIGNTYVNQGNYPEALKNFTTALKISETIGYKKGIAICYNNIGCTYDIEGNYPEALKNLLAALKIRESIGDKSGIAECYNNIGRIHIYLNKALEGKTWLQKGLAMSQETGMKENIKDSYAGLAQADSSLKNYKSALENYKMYISYRDSLFNEDNTKKITQTTMQYEFDKKQLADSLKNAEVRKLAAEKLSKQKNYTVMGAGLAVLLLGFSGFIFRNNKKLAAEKQKSESLLHNILPEEVSAELKQRGATTAKEFDAVTVLFTDFVNFTSAGERMSPKELVEELHFCFKTFDQIIDQYEIEKIKTVGDAYLAVSGLPNANARHAQNIVKAAKEIRDFMKQRSAALGDKTFEVRIGIHSGSVVAGIVGVKKFAYDIWGDTVNTAARMEQNGEAGKINISETTHELVKDEFECTYRGEIEAKGKGKMKMYFVE